jgi:hypothetical protein
MLTRFLIAFIFLALKRRPLRIVVPSGWVAEEVEEYRSLTHELVVEHVERATPRSAVMVLQQNEQLQLFLELAGINHGDVPAIVG